MMRRPKRDESSVLFFLLLLSTLGEVLSQEAPPDAEYMWQVIVGSCTRTCGPEGIKRTLVICIDSSLVTHDEIACSSRGLKKPVAPPEVCNRKPCPGVWREGDYGNCSSVCYGNRTRDVYCEQIPIVNVEALYTASFGEPMRAGDSACIPPKPQTMQECNRTCITPEIATAPTVNPSPMRVPYEDAFYAVGQNGFVHRGRQLSIDAEIIAGFPTPTLTWTLSDGTELAVNETAVRARVLANGTLVISSVEDADDGDYVATAKNEYGEDTKTSTMTVVCQPSLRIVPSEPVSMTIADGDRFYAAGGGGVMMIQRGGNLHVDVFLDGTCTDVVNYLWTLLDGSRLRSGETLGKYSVLDNGTLVMSNADLSLSGEYRVEISNIGGSDTAVSTLTVLCRPTIVIPPSPPRSLPHLDRSFAAGQSWRVRTGFTLRADVITDDTCPNVNVTWTLPNGNRRLGVGESSGRFSVLSNGSLVIRNANLGDTGRYAIEARTTGGTDTASSQLNVICEPSIIRGTGSSADLPDSNRYFIAGQRWRIRTGYDLYADIRIDPSCPDVDFRWQLSNGTELAQGESANGVRVLANGTLVLQNAQIADTGEYTATASNEGGMTSTRSSLQVICRPAIIPVLTPVTGLPESNRRFGLGQNWVIRKGYTLQADVFINSSCPDVNITWYLPNGESIQAGDTNGRFSVLSNGTLLITGADLGDMGQYRAEAQTEGGISSFSSSLTVHCRPRIVSGSGTPSGLPLSNRYFVVGERWTIRTGYVVYADVPIDPSCPDVDIEWRLPDGSRIGEGETLGDYAVLSNGTLVISNAQLSDAGRYRAVATTEGGTNAAHSDLEVICAPDIVPASGSRPFSDRVFGVGQPWVVRNGYNLQADVTINPNCPDVNISWILANGNQVAVGETSGKFSVLNNGTLIIQGTGLADIGSYTAVATTRGGTDDVTSPLNVICEPRIVSGTGTLPGLPVSDRYFVAGQDEWAIRNGWTLYADVVIDSRCPDVNITWLLADGSRLEAGQRRGRYSVLTNGTLVVMTTSLSDSGTYAVEAKTEGGISSVSSQLNVICRPQIVSGVGFLRGLPESSRYFVVGQSSWNIRTGYRAYADVIINQTCPDVDISWRLSNGIVLRAGESRGRFHVLANGTLVIETVRLSYRGVYEATATNRGGSDTASSRLDVGCRPRISPAPTLAANVPNSDRYLFAGQNWVVRRGQRLFVDVVVDPSCPEVDISWMVPNVGRVDAGGSSGDYEVLSNGTLVIRNSQVAKEGQYRVTIASSGGSDATNSELSIIFPPEIPIPEFFRNAEPDGPPPDVPRGKTVIAPVGQPKISTRPGQTLYIEVQGEIEAQPLADVGWLFPDGTTLETGGSRGRFTVADNGTLIIRNVRKSDEGSYVAQATNSAGSDSRTAQVFVTNPPVDLPPFTLNVHSGERLVLNAGFGEDNLTITWTIPGGQMLESGDTFGGKYSALSTRIVVENVQPGDDGTYTVTAKNRAGEAEQIITVTVTDYAYDIRRDSCTATCGALGVQVARVVCVDASTRAIANENRCVVAGRARPATLPPPLPCNRVSCRRDFTWDTGDWSPDPCSRSCSSYQRRRVSCLVINDATSADAIVDDIECVGYPKPLDRRICNEDQCFIAPKFRSPPPIVMPINKSSVYNRYDLYQSVIGVQGRYLFVDAVLAKGFPPGAVQWTLPDMTYLDPGQSRGRFTVFRNGTLRVSNVRYDDRGQYMTIARNRVGWDRAFAPFTIYVPPNITSHKVYRKYRPKDVSPLSPSHSVRPGEKAAIQCRYWGSPQPILSWTFNGAPVRFNNRVKVDNTGCLIISGVRASDAGVYRCIATNVVGVDTRTVSLAVERSTVEWVRTVPACSEPCGGGTRVVSSECRSMTTNLRVDSLECAEKRRPLSYRESCNVVSCPARWHASAYGTCSSTSCTESREIDCEQRINGKTVPVSQRNCAASAKPPEMRQCVRYRGTWGASDWSECSCGENGGQGKQKRKVKCVDPCGKGREVTCAGPKPRHHQKCSCKS